MYSRRSKREWRRGASPEGETAVKRCSSGAPQDGHDWLVGASGAAQEVQNVIAVVACLTDSRVSHIGFDYRTQWLGNDAADRIGALGGGGSA